MLVKIVSYSCDVRRSTHVNAKEHETPLAATAFARGKVVHHRKSHRDRVDFQKNRLHAALLCGMKDRRVENPTARANQ